MTVITDPKKIKLFQMKVRLAALGLEIKGMKRSGRSVYAIVKKEYNLEGCKEAVHGQFKSMIEAEEKQMELPLEPIQT